MPRPVVPILPLPAAASAYEDKVGRRAIRVMDLQNLQTLGAKIDRLLTHHNALRRGLDVMEMCLSLAPLIKAFQVA